MWPRGLSRPQPRGAIMGLKRGTMRPNDRAATVERIEHRDAVGACDDRLAFYHHRQRFSRDMLTRALLQLAARFRRMRGFSATK
jgi:hypothetical protein